MADPSTIPGLVNRWRADSITGVADGAAVTSWPDTGGNGNTATSTGTAPTYVAAGIGGQPSVRFTSTGSGTPLASAAATGWAQQTVIGVVKPSTVAGTLTIRGANSVSGLQFRIDAAKISLVRQAAANVGSSTSSVAAGVAAILAATYNSISGAYAFTLNGTTAGSGVNVQSLDATRTTILGQNGSGATTENFAGDMAEVLVWNRVLTTGELASVDAYLASRYGITVTDPPSPTDVTGIPGMSARWRADSITGVASGAAVGSWPETSGSGWTATQGTAASQPTFIAGALNGQPVVRFNGTSGWLASSAPAGAAAQTIAAVYSFTGTGGTIRGSQSGNGVQLRIAGGQAVLLKQNTAAVGTSTAVQTTGVYRVEIASYDSAAGASFTLNGAPDGGSTTVTPITANLSTLGRNGSNASEYLAGDLAEVLVWNRVLTTAERAVVDSYVQDRYGIAVADYSSGAAAATYTAAGSATAAVAAVGATVATVAVAGSDAAAVTATGAATAQTQTTGTDAATVAATGAASVTASVTGNTAAAVAAAGNVVETLTAAGTATAAVAATGAATALTIHTAAGAAAVAVTSAGAATTTTTISGATGSVVAAAGQASLTTAVTGIDGVSVGGANVDTSGNVTLTTATSGSTSVAVSVDSTVSETWNVDGSVTISVGTAGGPGVEWRDVVIILARVDGHPLAASLTGNPLTVKAAI